LREITVENCIRDISLVKNLVGEDWLIQNLKEIEDYKPPKQLSRLSFIDYHEKYHPLAYLIYQADKQLKSCAEKKYFEPTEQIVKLAYLGDNLLVLRRKNVKGLDRKIQDLTSLDKALFDKTTYEIEVASAYARQEYPIEFVETKSKEEIKTPDLFVNFQNGVEIECKKKDRQNDRDIRNKENWKLIIRKSSGMMKHYKVNYGIVIKTEQDPTKKDTEFILMQLDTLIQNRKEGFYRFQEKGIGITLQILSNRDEEIETGGFQVRTNEELDYETLDMDKKDEKGKVFIRNPKFFGFKSAMIPERINSVIESIKDARKQLSSKCSALIYVHLNGIDRKITEVDFKRLNSLLTDLLKRNSSITGIVISSEFFSKDELGFTYSHKARYLKNADAKHPLPKKFKVVGESQSI